MKNDIEQQDNEEAIRLGAYDEAPKSFQVVLYHGNCSDGFSAAWVARHYAFHNCLEEPVCIPINHDGVYNFPEEVDGKDVLVLDLSFPVEKMLELKNRANSVFVIDHHLTAPERCILSGIPLIYDKDECGSSLTWKVYFRNFPLPKFLDYIKAGDLWKWGNLPYDQEVVTALHSYENSFDVWDEFYDRSLKSKNPIHWNTYFDFTDHYRIEGETLERKAVKAVKNLMKTVKVMDLFDYRVPVCNATDHISKLGNEMALAFPECPFAAIYFDDQVTGMRHWSLRSVGENDVSQVAKRFGGGGHKNASGFSTKLPDTNLPRLEVYTL